MAVFCRDFSFGLNHFCIGIFIEENPAMIRQNNVAVRHHFQTIVTTKLHCKYQRDERTFGPQSKSKKKVTSATRI